MRGREVGRSREFHNLQIEGSNPSPATNAGMAQWQLQHSHKVWSLMTSWVRVPLPVQILDKIFLFVKFFDYNWNID